MLRRIGAWAFGLFAIPLSILPFYAYARYDGTGKILSLEVMRHFKGPALGSISQRGRRALPPPAPAPTATAC